MTTRKQIRDAAYAAIDGSYKKNIYKKRMIDARDEAEFVQIYLESGESEESIQTELAEAVLSITYYKQGVTSDDDLDSVMDVIHAAFQANFYAKAVVEGITSGINYEYTGFAYGDEEQSQHSTLKYTYIISY